MGGGFVTRPGFGLGQPDPSHPMTEFYLLLQRALDGAELTLPALYARFQAPAHRIYADEAAQFCAFSPVEKPGYTCLLGPGTLRPLYGELRADATGAPAALLLTEECSRTTYAVQLLPPFLWDEPLPPLPDTRYALSLQLTEADILLADTDPEALCRRLRRSAKGKAWLHHPRADRWVAERVALMQRLYR